MNPSEKAEIGDCGSAKSGQNRFRVGHARIVRPLAECTTLANGLEWEREGIGLLASNLHGDDLITTELLHNIMILSDTLNRAVHGEKISIQRAQQSLETGSLILAKLEA